MLKALRFVAHLAYGIGLAVYVGLGGSRPRERLAQAWSWKLLEILGIRVQMEGAPLRGAHLTVANHVSWLDIPVLAALEPTRFVSKAEVKHWPVAGWLAVAAGTFFIRRGKGGAAPLLERLVPHLRRHGCAVVFPEGTTTDGREVRPFHPRLFAAAIEAHCPVQPVTLQYGLVADGEDVAPFTGDASLVGHIARLLRADALEVRVAYGPPIHVHARSRDELAQEAEAYVRAALQPTPRARTKGAGALRWLRA